MSDYRLPDVCPHCETEHPTVCAHRYALVYGPLLRFTDGRVEDITVRDMEIDDEADYDIEYLHWDCCDTKLTYDEALAVLTAIGSERSIRHFEKEAGNG